MQIFQSLIQSHLNYCSIVWGFTAKSNIEFLFRIQKKGIRAIVPGFINYKYRNGELPGHTKPYFNEYKILGVRYIPSLLPISVRLVIAVIKRKLKCAVFDIQSMGENEEWTAKNFILNNIPGLRSSARLDT